MEVKQIYAIVNSITEEILGESAIINEDLSNITDVGSAIFDAASVDGYVKSLVNQIGKIVFVNRAYSGSVPSLLMDGWLYGSVMQKVQAEMPEASENESWDLTDGTSYDPNVFHKFTVSQHFFNKKVTFEVDASFTELQARQSLQSADQANAFMSMLENAVDRSMTVKIDSLVMRTINNAIAETLYSDYPTAQYTASSGVKAINLLKLYNDRFGTSLTAGDAITNAEFIRYASYIIGVYRDRISKLSTLFNISGKARFTPSDMQHLVLISDFAKSADAYLQSDVYHNEYTSLGTNYETVPYWQGSGTGYAWADISKIDVKLASDNTKTVTTSGILGVLFDRDAMGICNQDRRVTTQYNAKAEFINSFFKYDMSSFNALDENVIVFFVA